MLKFIRSAYTIGAAFALKWLLILQGGVLQSLQSGTEGHGGDLGEPLVFSPHRKPEDPEF